MVVEPITKVTVNIRTSLADELLEAAEARGETFTLALAEAIALKLFVDEARANGERLLLKKPKGGYTEIIFR